MRHELLAVTDSEHRLARGEDRRVHRGAARIVDAAGTAVNDDALGKSDLASWHVAGENRCVDAEIPDLARFEVTVLSPCIENDDLRSGVQVRLCHEILAELQGGEGRFRVAANARERDFQFVAESAVPATIDGGGQPEILVFDGLERIEIKSGHPRWLEVGNRGNQVGEETEGLPAAGG